MATEYEFVATIDELAASVLEFYSKPKFWKAALGSAPRYFVHVQVDGKHAFGLSKFCAFKDITVEEYLSICRYKAHGESTRKYISWLTGKDWIPRSEVDGEIETSFKNWILDFFPSYNPDNASFITLTPETTVRRAGKKVISPEDLVDALRFQREVGEVGESIALAFEFQRLKEQGVKYPSRNIDQVSKKIQQPDMTFTVQLIRKQGILK